MEKVIVQRIAEQLAHLSGEEGVQIAHSMNETNAFITARAAEVLALRPGEHLLEIGPGNGRLSLDLVRQLGPDGRYLGVEHEQGMAELASANLSGGGAQIEMRSGDFLTHKPAEVDAVLAVNVVYFFEDIERFFRLCYEWLRPGGRLVLGVRSVPAMVRLPFVAHGFQMRSVDEQFRALSSVGFEAIDARYYQDGTVAVFDDLRIELDSIVLRAIRPPL